MIVPGKTYSRPFEIVRDNSLVNADSLPSLVLWRNGAATLVPVTPTTTANVGKYYLSFTADPAWQATDDLEVFGSAVIAGKTYTGTVWTSFAEPEGTVVQGLTAYGVATAANVSDGTTAITGKLPDTLEDGRMKAVISDAQVVDVVNQVVLAALQTDPGQTAERTLEDAKPLMFSWPNSTDTVLGEVSIDAGEYAAVLGTIAYLREESGVHYYTLAYNAADRPAVEGTARYRFYSGTSSMYANLRVLKASPRVVDVQAGLALEATSQSVLSGVTALHSNDRSEFF